MMSTFPVRFFVFSLIAAYGASSAGSEQEQKLHLLIQQLDILEMLTQQASRHNAPESGARYRFDYPRLIQDIQRIRLGVKGYLSPSRAQPHDPNDLAGDYRLDSPPPEPSP
ncbi:RAQPRD family integrative conjugative element protein [Pseudomonas fluorescens]|uniref:integrative conjugative element protein, RAQPRD family n=1 Tax=Pseudomonas fluorescens TaxID=294 RepID=UPI0010E87691|nr:RAQPRD family integrative conjugative element protein [Pseudomonas fluorescens]TCV62194.1 RAQPRD family integrative conjugative element protein [Pseudomonas fluorescens]